MHELTDLLEIKLQHAFLKHPQKIGVVQISHSALKRFLEPSTDEKWTTWYKDANLTNLYITFRTIHPLDARLVHFSMDVSLLNQLIGDSKVMQSLKKKLPQII